MLSKSKTQISYHLQIKKGQELVREKKLDKAIEYFERTINENPNRYEGYYHLGSLFLGLKRHQEAVEQFKRAYEINPKLNDMSRFMGRLYFSQNRLDDAFPFLLEAIEENPDDVQCRLLLSQIYIIKKASSEAIRHLEKIIDIDPTNLAALILIGKAYWWTGDLEKAKKYVSIILEHDQANTGALSLLGQIYFEKKDGYRALFCFLECLRLGDNNADILANIGFVYEQQKFLDEAEHFWLKAFKIDSQNLNAMKGMGLSHLMKGRYRRAIKMFDKVLSFNPFDYVMRDSIAYCYYKAGDEDKALVEYSKIFSKPYYIDTNALKYLREQIPPTLLRKMLDSPAIQDSFENQKIFADLFEEYNSITVHIEPKEKPMIKKSYVVLSGQDGDSDKIQMGHTLFSMVIALAIERKHFKPDEYLMNKYEQADFIEVMSKYFDSKNPVFEFIIRKGEKWIEDPVDDTRKVYVHRINDATLFQKYGVKFNLIERIPEAKKDSNITGAYMLNKSITEVVFS